MKALFLQALVVIAALAPHPIAIAQTSAARAGGPAVQPAPQPVVRIAPAAADAVQTVNAFMEALATGKMVVARDLLDSGVVVISNGIAFGNREQYMARQAPTDAAYLQKSQRRLLRRDARAGDSFAWVISEKAFRAQPQGQPNQGQPPAMSISETMLLVKSGAGWKIAHIHWSTRPAGGR